MVEDADVVGHKLHLGQHVGRDKNRAVVSRRKGLDEVPYLVDADWV